ncbi:hypothetical protein GCM10023185_14010 [Hymenobacter saemangeumensis]|uniref:Delta-60 repeat domain-containing protein n=1 Tax=Hymenobacter saemangeumensis TaxID=1084522 RepID=A0ABP8I859_9BACT
MDTHALSRILPGLCLLWLGLLLSSSAAAQVPAWRRVVNVVSLQGAGPKGLATATDGAGNVYVTGGFEGTVRFGTTQLTSAGGSDVFVAKWSSATGRWIWAYGGGGTGFDTGHSIAVSGNSIYLTGQIGTGTPTQEAPEAMQGLFSRIVLAAPVNVNFQDVLVAKLTDAGPTARVNWAYAAGGPGLDVGRSIAIDGPNVYLTGSVEGIATSPPFRFGPNRMQGLSRAKQWIGTNEMDTFIAKYVDAGDSAKVGWVMLRGSEGPDEGQGIAVSGGNVYVTGGEGRRNPEFRKNNPHGPVMAAAAGPEKSQDMFLVKYLDAGATATEAWARYGGGTYADAGQALAVSGSSVYVTGYVQNDWIAPAGSMRVRFDGVTLRGLSPAPNREVFVAKYTDAGSTATLAWAKNIGVGRGNSIAVSGNALLVTGAKDGQLFVAKYLDDGPAPQEAWTITGSGSGLQGGSSISLAAGRAYITGTAGAKAQLGGILLTNQQGTMSFLAEAVNIESNKRP